MSRTDQIVSTQDTDASVTRWPGSAAAQLCGAIAERQDLLGRWLRVSVADAVARLTGRARPAEQALGWSDATEVGDDGLGLDSLALLDCIAGLNAALGLSRTGVEDHLLVRPTLGEWTDLLCVHFEKLAGDPAVSEVPIVFLTSGSTGKPKRVVHEFGILAEEIATLRGVVGPRARIAALVPPHHIYGFLFTVLLPAAIGCPMADLRTHGPGTAVRRLGEGDLLIATPFQLEQLLGSGERFVPGTRAVTSTAPAPASMWARLADAGLESVAEIFGSSETSGLGIRTGGEEPFALLGHLERAGDGIVRPARPDRPLQLQDEISWTGPRQFLPRRRRDGAVQVGGVNVFPARVRDALMGLPDLADAAVRLDDRTGRLKAFLVPAADAVQEDVEAAVRSFAADRLSAPERPQMLRTGSALPRDAMGKATDWG